MPVLNTALNIPPNTPPNPHHNTSDHTAPTPTFDDLCRQITTLVTSLAPHQKLQFLADLIRAILTIFTITGTPIASALGSIVHTAEAHYLGARLGRTLTLSGRTPSSPTCTTGESPLPAPEVPIKTELHAHTSFATSRCTGLDRAAAAAIANHHLAELLHTGRAPAEALTEIHSIRLGHITADADAALVDDYYQRCAEELDLTLHLAEGAHSRVYALDARKLALNTLAHPDFESIRLDKGKRTLWSFTTNGITIRATGPTQLVEHIEDSTQAIAKHYLPFVNQDPIVFIDYLNGNPHTVPPLDDDAIAKASQAAATTPTGAATTWSQARGMAFFHSTLIGLNHLTGLSPLSVVHRHRTLGQTLSTLPNTYRLIFDSADGGILAGSTTNPLFSSDVLRQDLAGNWIIPRDTIDTLAAHSCTLNLGFVDSTPPADHPTYSPTTAQRLWVVNRDGGCMFPGCGTTTSLELNHIHPYHASRHTTHNQTSIHNLHCLCTRHHRMVTQGAAKCWTDDGGLTTLWALNDGALIRTIGHGPLINHLVDRWEEDHGHRHPVRTGQPLPESLPAEDITQRIAAAASAFLSTHRIDGASAGSPTTCGSTGSTGGSAGDSAEDIVAEMEQMAFAGYEDHPPF